MSYTPTEWATGDVITAEKLNNMEGGIAGGQKLFIIHATGVANNPDMPTTPVLDKTFDEIKTAYDGGLIPIITYKDSQVYGEASSVLRFDYAMSGGPEGTTFIFSNKVIYYDNNYTGIESRTLEVTQSRIASNYSSKRLAYYAGS